MNVKRTTAALAAGALALTLAGCTFSTPDTALTVDGEAIPAGVYLAYQLQNYQTVESALSDEGLDMDLDAAYEDTTVRGWIEDATAQDMGRYVHVRRAFGEQGLSFTEEEQASIDDYAAQLYDSMEDYLAENGVGEESYRLYYETETMYSALVEAYIEENSGALTDDELKAYLDETYVHARELTLPSTDEEGTALDDEAQAAVDSCLDEAAERLAEGEDFDTVAAETLEKACEAAGRTYDEELLDTYALEAFYDVQPQDSDAPLVQAVREAEIGDAGIAEDAYGARTAYVRISNYETQEALDEIRDTVASEILSARYEEQTDAAAQAMEIDASAAREEFPVSRVRE